MLCRPSNPTSRHCCWCMPPSRFVHLGDNPPSFLTCLLSSNLWFSIHSLTAEKLTYLCMDGQRYLLATDLFGVRMSGSARSYTDRNISISKASGIDGLGPFSEISHRIEELLQIIFAVRVQALKNSSSFWATTIPEKPNVGGMLISDARDKASVTRLPLPETCWMFAVNRLKNPKWWSGFMIPEQYARPGFMGNWKYLMLTYAAICSRW